MPTTITTTATPIHDTNSFTLLTYRKFSHGNSVGSNNNNDMESQSKSQKRRRRGRQKKRIFIRPNPNEKSVFASFFANDNPKPNKHLPPLPGQLKDTDDDKIHYPQNLREWKDLLKDAKDEYLSTFDGFLSNHGALEKTHQSATSNTKTDTQKDTNDTTQSSSSSSSLSKQVEQQMQNVQQNFKNNLTVLQNKQERDELIQEVKDTTGIQNQQDIKELASQMMILATECIQEFMKGYRNGRDEEVDKMLNEYFKDLNKNDEEDDKKAESSEEEQRKNRREFHKKRKKRLRV